ncbi:MAG: hypothetical protein II136_07785, partial [Prevotella sp.]|nr:hypothetical protein [Prevotella sp.]
NNLFPQGKHSRIGQTVVLLPNNHVLRWLRRRDERQFKNRVCLFTSSSLSNGFSLTAALSPQIVKQSARSIKPTDISLFTLLA